MSTVCIDLNCVVIVGELNIHIDNPKDDSDKELLYILDNSQHVTDNKGRILDLVISKGLHISEMLW